VLTQGTELPPLEPSQLQLYTEACSLPEAERRPVKVELPPARLAHTLAALLAKSPGARLCNWETLENLPTGIQWDPGGVKKGDLSYKGDPNPWMDQGKVENSGRKFYVLVSGSPTEVKTVYLDEGATHPRGENLWEELYELGFAERLVRCGPVKTKSTNDWHSATSSQTQPAMLEESIRYDVNEVQETYGLRLDSTPPKRHPCDRDPGAAGCQ
jgi:hypothetical protein